MIGGSLPLVLMVWLWRVGKPNKHASVTLWLINKNIIWNFKYGLPTVAALNNEWFDYKNVCTLISFH